MNAMVPDQDKIETFIEDKLFDVILQPAVDVARSFGVETILEKLDTDDSNDFNWYPWEVF